MLSLPGRCQIHLYDYLSMWNAGPIRTPILGNIILHYIIPIGICILLLIFALEPIRILPQFLYYILQTFHSTCVVEGLGTRLDIPRVGIEDEVQLVRELSEEVCGVLLQEVIIGERVVAQLCHLL